MDNKRPTWAEIDLNAIKNNLQVIRQRLTPETKIMATVKADAYGHGILQVSRVCRENGVDYLGVATLDEAVDLLDAGIYLPILVLGYISPGHAALVVDKEIRTAVFNYDYALALSRAAIAAGRKAYVHIKIDTGMNRLGFSCCPESVEMLCRIAKLPGIYVEGIFTHFAESDNEDREFTSQQLALFNELIKQSADRGISIPVKHVSNSAAIINYPQAHLNMVRAGIIMYGLYPSPSMKKLDFGIIPAMSLKSRVSFIKYAKAGDTVSYGRTYKCQQETRVATVPIGYADGYSRLLSNKAFALINGHKVPLIGRVCMDQCLFDISGKDDIKEGDEVILFGKNGAGITADDLAEIMGTINYEIVCSVSSRVPRVYI